MGEWRWLIIPRTEIRPQPKQEIFLSSPADIAIFGGAAGGGKSFALLLDPLRFVGVRGFGAVIFRRTNPQITQQGGLLDESYQLYSSVGGILNRTLLKWTFPQGTSVTLDAMQYESDVYSRQGAQIPMIGFDELTHFTPKQFWYMFSRNRSVCGVRPYMRAGCNPDPDSFVASLIEWWINQDTGYPIPKRSGVLRWFYRINDVLCWYDTRQAAEAAHPELAKDIPPTSLTFIPSLLDDNAILTSRDPGYRAKLVSTGEVEKERLLRGNWKIRPAAGKVIDRSWFEIVDVIPAGGEECRFWDFAGTAKKLAKDDPDYTASTKIRKLNGRYYVTDSTAVQEGPTEVERIYKNTSLQDRDEAYRNGARYQVRFEQEPGSAAIRDAWRLVSLLDGLDVQAVDARGDKLTRVAAFASQARAGNVKLLRGDWNERWLSHMHAIPDGAHDDIMDATSGAYNNLADAASTLETGDNPLAGFRG